MVKNVYGKVLKVHRNNITKVLKLLHSDKSLTDTTIRQLKIGNGVESIHNKLEYNNEGFVYLVFRRGYKAITVSRTSSWLVEATINLPIINFSEFLDLWNNTKSVIYESY